MFLSFPVPEGHVVNLPGQALNMQNICTFCNRKNPQLPGKLKTVHATAETVKKKVNYWSGLTTFQDQVCQIQIIC